MKKICLNCHFCDVAFPDVDVRFLVAENDYLICLKTGKKVDDDDTCEKYNPSKGREDDLKCGC